MIHNNLTKEVVQDVTNNMNPYFGSQELRALLRSLNSVAGMASGGSEEVPWASITGVPAALTAAQAAGTPSIRAIGTSATTAAAGNHTHNATAITATAVGGGTATNVQGILAELAGRIAALESA